MARSRALSKETLPFAQLFWMASLGALLLGITGLAYLMLVSGKESYQKQALESGQRVEFSPKTGEVNGKIFRLADIEKLQNTPKEPPESTIAGRVPPPPSYPSSEVTNTLSSVEKETERGVIPVIAQDGKMAWQVFSTPLPAPVTGPKIALILNGLGLARAPTEAAISLPKTVTLSFSTYSTELLDWSRKAHMSGHEILLDLPMQGTSYPMMDPGPNGILSTLSPEENIRRILDILPKARFYVGMLGALREVVSKDVNVIAPALKTLSEHGLLYASTMSKPQRGMLHITDTVKTPVVYTQIILDEKVSEQAILDQLAKAEAIARNKGTVLILGRAFPVTIDLVQAWQQHLAEKGITLVPLTVLVKEEEAP